MKHSENSSTLKLAQIKITLHSIYHYKTKTKHNYSDLQRKKNGTKALHGKDNIILNPQINKEQSDEITCMMN